MTAPCPPSIPFSQEVRRGRGQANSLLELPARKGSVVPKEWAVVGNRAIFPPLTLEEGC